jgi:hypothetical protein
MPQTIEDVWPFLVDWLPVAWRRPLLVIAACTAALALFAFAFNPVVEFAQRLAPGPMPSRDDVLRRLAEGKFRRRDADYVLLRIEGRGAAARTRRQGRRALRALARKGAPVEREAVKHFAMGDIERGFALLQGHFAHAAKPTARALKHLRALAAGRKSERAGKYAPLGAFFENEKETSISMKFVEIERVLGSLLPTFARKRRSWWTNEPDAAHAHARSWVDTGWRVAKVDLSKDGGVTFERPNPAEKASLSPEAASDA